MADAHEAPQTLEGYYVLHDLYRVDWVRWHAAPAAERTRAREQLTQALAAVVTVGAGAGDSATYAVVGQKADLLFLHYRQSPAELKQAELELRRLAMAAWLTPAGSYLSVIEASLYEAAAMAQKKLGDQGLTPASPEYATTLEKEMAVQRQRLESRVRPVLSGAAWCCFYPMSKRRGEQVNWYDLPLDERRALMRGHGRLGHKYHQQVAQVISGSIGLDDWEWAVDLHADDPLVFKKLVTEMRFDPASSRYAEFGPFLVGRRLTPAELGEFLEGRMPR
jgi:chlorite dismutase